jgi:hypothetical protein
MLTRESCETADATVVPACGQIPDDTLHHALVERGLTNVHPVGGALAPRWIMYATIDGAGAAMTIWGNDGICIA